MFTQAKSFPRNTNLLIQEPFMFLFDDQRLLLRYEHKHLVGNSTTLCFYHRALESTERAAGRCELCHDSPSHLSPCRLDRCPSAATPEFEATCDFFSVSGVISYHRASMHHAVLITFSFPATLFHLISYAFCSAYQTSSKSLGEILRF